MGMSKRQTKVQVLSLCVLRRVWRVEPDRCEGPQVRMKKLEEMRLEVDSRRRTVQELAHKVSLNPQALKLQSSYPSPFDPALDMSQRIQHAGFAQPMNTPKPR